MHPSYLTNSRSGATISFGGWLMTHSGKHVHPLDPRPDEIDADDIAHALSHLCRFAGHCRRFHSVAFHSVLVSEMVGTFHPRLALAALYHDAAEAYIADIPRPVKHGLRSITQRQPFVEDIAAMETRLLRCIFDALAIPWPAPAEWDIISLADDAILRAEAEQLMPEAAWASGLPEPPAFLSIGHMNPDESRACFAGRAAMLRARTAA
jgi:uncharacterized protein